MNMLKNKHALYESIMNKVLPIVREAVNEAKGQQTLSMEDLKDRVDDKLSEMTSEDWMYEIRWAIRSRIQGMWEDEMAKSTHPTTGSKGYVFSDRESSSVTKFPNSRELDMQTNIVIRELGLN